MSAIGTNPWEWPRGQRVTATSMPKKGFIELTGQSLPKPIVTPSWANLLTGYMDS